MTRLATERSRGALVGVLSGFRKDVDVEDDVHSSGDTRCQLAGDKHRHDRRRPARRPNAEVAVSRRSNRSSHRPHQHQRRRKSRSVRPGMHPSNCRTRRSCSPRHRLFSRRRERRCVCTGTLKDSATGRPPAHVVESGPPSPPDFPPPPASPPSAPSRLPAGSVWQPLATPMVASKYRRIAKPARGADSPHRRRRCAAT